MVFIQQAVHKLEKTAIMFISTKRQTLPTHIEFEKEKIEVVEAFKLLGVTLDNKLNFVQHAANICHAINKRLYSIKKLFYLSFNVNKPLLLTILMLINLYFLERYCVPENKGLRIFLALRLNSTKIERISHFLAALTIAHLLEKSLLLLILLLLLLYSFNK